MGDSVARHKQPRPAASLMIPKVLSHPRRVGTQVQHIIPSLDRRAFCGAVEVIFRPRVIKLAPVTGAAQRAGQAHGIALSKEESRGAAPRPAASPRDIWAHMKSPFICVKISPPEAARFGLRCKCDRIIAPPSANYVGCRCLLRPSHGRCGTGQGGSGGRPRGFGQWPSDGPCTSPRQGRP